MEQRLVREQTGRISSFSERHQYPRGLKGKDIPFGARLFAVVDVYDALTSEGPIKLLWVMKKRSLWLERNVTAILTQKQLRHFWPFPITNSTNFKILRIQKAAIRTLPSALATGFQDRLEQPYVHRVSGLTSSCYILLFWWQNTLLWAEWNTISILNQETVMSKIKLVSVLAALFLFWTVFSLVMGEENSTKSPAPPGIAAEHATHDASAKTSTPSEQEKHEVGKPIGEAPHSAHTGHDMGQMSGMDEMKKQDEAMMAHMKSMQVLMEKINTTKNPTERKSWCMNIWQQWRAE
jgi:hypothetical protein